MFQTFEESNGSGAWEGYSGAFWLAGQFFDAEYNIPHCEVGR